jgi:flagellar hook-associated protein 1 FlgK
MKGTDALATGTKCRVAAKHSGVACPALRNSRPALAFRSPLRLALRLHANGTDFSFRHGRRRTVALDGILSGGLSALLTNTAALRVTSDNIANVNTEGYSRRVVQQQTLAPDGRLMGVDIASINRVVNNYLDREVLNANASASRWDIHSSILDQLNASLGHPGDGTSIGSQLDSLYSMLGQVSLDPSSLATRLGALNQFQSLAGSISDLSAGVQALRLNADGEVASTVSQANSLIQQIYTLNPQIEHAIVNGDSASGLLDQRDTLVQQLAGLVGIRTTEQADGRLFIATSDGIQLVGDNYATLSYSPSAGPSFKPVTVQMMNGITGQPIGQSQIFDPHATSGKLRGLLDVRDQTLVGVGEELGQLAQTLSLAFNAQQNANATVPPPTELDGRETGLLDTDALNFSGSTSIGIVDSTGVLQHSVAIDFTGGTLSVDGGPSVSLGSTIGSFVTALNTALGANGSATFSNGVLQLTATGGDGLVISDDANNPTSRGGIAFSHFFGLNDLFQSSANSIVTTGLSASDTAGFAPGGAISLLLKGPQGQRVGETTVSVTGTTIGDMVTALNTAFTGKATFALDANGQLQVTPAAAYSGYEVEVTLDSTSRGNTGQTFSSLFGLGTGQQMARAQDFSLSSAVAGQPQRLGFAQPMLTSATALGSQVVTPGDNRGLLALQDLLNTTHSFGKAGGLPARDVSFSDYAASFYQDVSARGTAVDESKSSQDTRLQIAKQAQSQAEGVNLDEELAHMMTLQQAYNAGARLIKLAQDLYDQLLQVVK